MKDDIGLFSAEPWLMLGVDPLTGFSNMLAFISDLPGPGSRHGGVAVGFDLMEIHRLNEEQGEEAGDRALVGFARSLERAASGVGSERVDLYRMGGDEFCAVIRGSGEDARSLIAYLTGDGDAHPFRHSLLEFSPETGSSGQAFFDIWAPLQDALQLGRDVRVDPMRQVAQRLAERVKETVEQLRVSRRMAYTDDVSGLPNHRAARFLLNEYLGSCDGERRRLSVLFVDGDNLRQYNDNLGYGSGNEMIRRLGAVLSAATLPTEVVARWLSGDEFMVILPGCGKARAIEKAVAISESVKEEFAHWVYPVTVSIGVATFPDDATEVDRLLERVEEANAKAKSMGKDMVCEA